MDDEIKYFDKESALEAVRENGLELQHASKELQEDREVVMAASRNNGRSFEYASEILQDEPEFVLEILQHDSELEFELSALKYYNVSCANALQFVSPRLKLIMAKNNEQLFYSLKDLQLSTRAYRLLEKSGCCNVLAILMLGYEYLCNISGFGPKCLEEVGDRLRSWGYSLYESGIGEKLLAEMREKLLEEYEKENSEATTNISLEDIKERNEELKIEIALKREILKELAEQKEMLSTIAELDSQIAELQNPVNSKENSDGHTR